MAKRLWFKRKTFGWGWTPSTWEGWLVLAVWGVVFYFSLQNLDHEWLKNMLVITLATLILLVISYLKGESPRWQWGKPKSEK